MNQFVFFFMILFMAQFSCNAQKSNQKMDKNESYWKEKLSPEAFHVLREKGTERPFSGQYNMHFEKGVYLCNGCGTELFNSDSKFDGHCGWPSFDGEIPGDKIEKIADHSHGMVRTEIVCKNCGGHLGHLFDDGPTASGLRYCVNSLSLNFTPKSNEMDEIIVGGGCFWCIESAFNAIEGVVKAESGYAGGTSKNPTYEEVCSGNTGHAEVVRIQYDSKKISKEALLDMFFILHDPTQLNRQGNDIGTQYRSALFYKTEAEKLFFEDYISKLKKEDEFYSNMVTTLEKLDQYYVAEAYHQGYFERNPQNAYCAAVVGPKLDKFKKNFSSKLKSNGK